MLTACLAAAVTASKVALAAKALVATGTVLTAAQPLADRIKNGKREQKRRA